MDIAEFKKVIQNQEGERDSMLKNPDLINRDVGTGLVEKSLKHPNIIAILGIRRCGKSTLSWILLKDRKYAYINFDDELLYGIKVDDFDRLLKAFYDLYGDDLQYFLLDEIQNVKGWELFINKLGRTKKVIVTGSNSNLLGGELATHLTGRYNSITLFPFSFNEFLAYKKVPNDYFYGKEFRTERVAKALKYLEEYIQYGGFPEGYKFTHDRLKSTFRDIITKDVTRRYRIKNIESIESLSKYLISIYSNEISFSSLRNIVGIKKIETVKNYLTYLENSYLFFLMERFSFKLKQQMIAPKKIYCIDTGMINAMTVGNSRNIGRLMENLVAVELLRRKNYSNDMIEVYYWKDHNNHEVDFLIKAGKNVVELIQTSYVSDLNLINRREIDNLIKASEELHCNNLSIITWDYESVIEKEGREITCIPLWKWLMGTALSSS